MRLETSAIFSFCSFSNEAASVKMCPYVLSLNAVVALFVILQCMTLSESLPFPYIIHENGKCSLTCSIPIDVDTKCGSDGITYQNIEELECARERCFPELKFAYDGNCLDSPLHGVIPLQITPSNGNSLPLVINRPTQLTKSEKRKLNWARLKSEQSKIYFTKDSESEHREKYGQSNGNNGLSLGGNNGLSLGQPSNVNSIQPSAKKDADECNADDCTCDFVLAPVCGSNGVTYGNECILQCIQKCDPVVALHHSGFCGKIFFPLNQIPFFRVLKMEVE